MSEVLKSREEHLKFIFILTGLVLLSIIFVNIFDHGDIGLKTFLEVIGVTLIYWYLYVLYYSRHSGKHSIELGNGIELNVTFRGYEYEWDTDFVGPTNGQDIWDELSDEDKRALFVATNTYFNNLHSGIKEPINVELSSHKEKLKQQKLQKQNNKINEYLKPLEVNKDESVDEINRQGLNKEVMQAILQRAAQRKAEAAANPQPRQDKLVADKFTLPKQKQIQELLSRPCPFCRGGISKSTMICTNCGTGFPADPEVHI
ncbi:hypothetical protein MCEKH45_00700 [Methylophilaceae bacterium]